MLAEAGFTLPEDAAPKGMAAMQPPAFFASKSAEEVYDWLNEQPKEDGGDDGEGESESESEDEQDAGSESDGAGAGAAEGEDEGDGEPDGGQPGDDGDSGDGDGGESEGDDAGESGGGQGGDDGQEGEDGGQSSHDPSGTGEVMDAKERAGGEELDQDKEEQEWDEAMHQSAQIAKAEGKLPGSMQGLVESVHVSQMDWRALLRRFMEDVSKTDYTWSAPNRRFIDQGLYLPSVHSEGMGPIVLLMDISGSVVYAGDMLGRMWTEVREIAQELQPERVHVVQVDTRVSHVEEFESDDLPEALTVRGGGGTDFRPGFDWVEDEGLTPACLLYFTDMECSSFPEEPQYPVLWCDYGQEDTWKRRGALRRDDPARLRMTPGTASGLGGCAGRQPGNPESRRREHEHTRRNHEGRPGGRPEDGTHPDGVRGRADPGGDHRRRAAGPGAVPGGPHAQPGRLRLGVRWLRPVAARLGAPASRDGRRAGRPLPLPGVQVGGAGGGRRAR